MQVVNLLHGKILRAEVTDCSLNYEGSMAIDSELMDKAGILPYERILVGNISNGERFETYAIAAPAGSKAISLNGAAARKGSIGDRVVILTFCQMPIEEARTWKPKIVVLSDRNRKIVRQEP